MAFKQVLKTGFAAVALLFSALSVASPRADIAWEKIEGGALLVDVRTPGEYSAKHLDNAINYPLNTIGRAFATVAKNENIVVYCRSGNRSGQAKAFLEHYGFTNVHNGGGLEELLASK